MEVTKDIAMSLYRAVDLCPVSRHVRSDLDEGKYRAQLLSGADVIARFVEGDRDVVTVRFFTPRERTEPPKRLEGIREVARAIEALGQLEERSTLDSRTREEVSVDGPGVREACRAERALRICQP